MSRTPESGEAGAGYLIPKNPGNAPNKPVVQWDGGQGQNGRWGRGSKEQVVMSHKATAGPGPTCHTGDTWQVGTRERESEGDAQAMSSQAQPFLSRVGIALFVAAAMGGCVGAVQGTDPAPWHQGPSTCSCVLRLGSAATAQGIRNTAHVLSPAQVVAQSC